MRAHPYAESWPLLGDDELAELADDVAANGLRDAIVTYQGSILDGRNRYAACERAGAEPHFREFEGTDDEALAFVQSVNNSRRHQSKGSLAASWALSMLAAGKRDGGRWAYGLNSENSQNLTNRMRADLGVIADHAPDLLVTVRDDTMSLNAAYESACQDRDRERNRLEREERQRAEEAEAEAFIKDNAPDLADLVGSTLETYVEAQAVWEKRNREEAEKRRKARAEHEASVKRHADYLRAFLSGVTFAAQMAEHELRGEVLDALPPHDRDRFLRIEKEATWPTTI